MKEQARLGLPDGFKMATSFPFSGMNQEASRIGIEDAEFFYRENFIKIGPGRLRTIWDVGVPIYTAPSGKTIVWFIFFNIAAVNYAAVFLSDGTADQVNVATLAITHISTVAGTFYAGTQLPAACQSGSQYLLIVNNITSNSYWIWDGTVLYTAGSLGPGVTITSGGAGYSSAPTVTAYGGTGSGATFSPSIANGSVVSVVLTNPGTGYSPGDVVQLAFTGGGSNTSAKLTAVLQGAVISAIDILAPGSGYTNGTYALGITGGGGTGATGTFTVAGNIVTSIALTAGGSGYTSTPTISFPGAGGSGAQGKAILVPGGIASVTVTNGGTGYNSTPTLTVVGGGGTGATLTATISGGAITGVAVNVAGTGYTSVPAIEVQSGVNNAASATVSLMPFGISGSSIETFQSRVWIPFPNQAGKQNNGGTFLVSAPSSITDFSTSDGGLIFVSNDRFLRANYVNIRQSNGYLYPFGDSSVEVISNVQTSGNPSTTTFNYQNVDPQIGMAWRDTCQDFSRTILFSNSLGVFGLYGGAVTKVSKKIDQIFDNAIFPPTAGAVTPCAAVASIHTIRTYLILMTIMDPFTAAPRNVLLAWDETEWFVVSQTPALIYIGTQEIDSDLTAWGTDGTTLMPLMETPSTLITKKLSSKLWGAANAFLTKLALGFYVQGTDRSAAKVGISLNVNVDSELTSTTIPNSPLSITAVSPNMQFIPTGSGDIYGQQLGYTLTSTSPDFELDYLGLGYSDWWGGWGSPPA
jgi:hypothetical protein